MEKKKIYKNTSKIISGEKKSKKIDNFKVFHETGKIIANPLIYKDIDYFD